MAWPEESCVQEKQHRRYWRGMDAYSRGLAHVAAGSTGYAEASLDRLLQYLAEAKTLAVRCERDRAFLLLSANWIETRQTRK